MVTWSFGKRRKASLGSIQILEKVSEPQLPVSQPPAPQHEFQRSSQDIEVPQQQSALLLHAIRQPYEVASEYAIPEPQHDHELVIKVNAVGLNPIDWKAPDFNFGIPTLPYISGRELAGTVIHAPASTSTSTPRIRKGDIVLVPSTDYRDLRKAAFQEYTIASSFNTIRLPHQVSVEAGSILGVAFVSSILALGICMGVDFSSIEDGPDLLSIVRSIDPERLPADIRDECLEGINTAERAREGDFLVIWGGSSTCAHTMKQIARLAGLKIISVVDTGKHGLRLSSHSSIRPDLVVDSHDPERAIAIIQAATGHSARFGFDTMGKESAAHLLRALSSSTVSGKTADLPSDPESYNTYKSTLPTPPSTPSESTTIKDARAHLVGLTGLPKGDVPEGTTLHNVPIKLFHEIPEVGEALCAWCERLLAKGLLQPPDVVGTVEGLEGINGGLDRLRRREISGGRLVAVLN